MTTVINSNGSRWYGQEPATVEELIEVLGQEPLDRTFERFGGFISDISTVEAWGRPVVPEQFRTEPHTIRFFGNFLKLSHVFNIDTNDPDVIDRLTKAIQANQQRPDYLSQEGRSPKCSSTTEK